MSHAFSGRGQLKLAGVVVLNVRDDGLDKLEEDQQVAAAPEGRAGVEVVCVEGGLVGLVPPPIISEYTVSGGREPPEPQGTTRNHRNHDVMEGTGQPRMRI